MAEKAQTSAQASANETEIPELESNENPEIETLFTDDGSDEKKEDTNEQNSVDKPDETEIPPLENEPTEEEEELIEIKINTNLNTSSIFSNPCENKTAGKYELLNYSNTLFIFLN